MKRRVEWFFQAVGKRGARVVLAHEFGPVVGRLPRVRLILTFTSPVLSAAAEAASTTSGHRR